MNLIQLIIFHNICSPLRISQVIQLQLEAMVQPSEMVWRLLLTAREAWLVYGQNVQKKRRTCSSWAVEVPVSRSRHPVEVPALVLIQRHRCSSDEEKEIFLAE
jgi:hypothetical protein